MRVPMKGMLCGYCGKPVTRHNNAVEEKVPWPSADDPQQLRKQLWHKRRCWSKEVRLRLEKLRAERPLTIELPAIAATLTPQEIEQADQRAMAVVRQSIVADPSECFEARVVSADELRQEEPVTARLDGGEKTKRGDLAAAVRLAIEARKGKWWTRAEIKKEVLELGIQNSERDSVGQAIISEARVQQAERRVLDGHTLEYRVVATARVAELPPLMPKPYQPKPGKPVEERHSTRPGPWQKDVTLVRPSVLAERAAGAEVVHSIVEEPSMAETVNGTTHGKARQHTLFMLKSERMLNELERNLTAMVRSAVEQTRQAIEKLVEEELE